MSFWIENSMFLESVDFTRFFTGGCYLGTHKGGIVAWRGFWVAIAWDILRVVFKASVLVHFSCRRIGIAVIGLRVFSAMATIHILFGLVAHSFLLAGLIH